MAVMLLHKQQLQAAKRANNDRLPPRAKHHALCNLNVNIRAVERKDELPTKHFADADVICLQETKAHREQVNPEWLPPKAGRAGGAAPKNGYSGVAIYAKQEPDDIIEGLGEEQFDSEGRVISALFGDIFVTSAYFPNAQEAGKRIDYKIAFCKRMEEFLQEWNSQGVKTCLMGDYNIAHQPIDAAQRQPRQPRIPPRRARMDEPLPRPGLPRRIPRNESRRNRRLHLVDLPRRGPRPQRGLAHRLRDR